MAREISILTIDDEEQICFAFNELFRLQGWSAYSALNMEDGLKIFDQKKPDIVLLDYHMPHINGVEGCRMIRRRDPHVPILVFTIEEDPKVVDAFLEAGASDFAIKPIKGPDIISRIRLHLRLLEKTRTYQNIPLEKGMSLATLTLVEEYLKKCREAATVDEIAKGTGLANQTIYRYLQYLIREGKVEQKNSYGKVGRPRRFYRIISPKDQRR